MTPGILGAPIVDAALLAAAPERELHERLWLMTAAQRTAAFYRGELSLGDCLAWAQRCPEEPPRAADGEYLFIAVRTPEWADADQPSRAVSSGVERGL